MQALVAGEHGACVMPMHGMNSTLQVKIMPGVGGGGSAERQHHCPHLQCPPAQGTPLHGPGHRSGEEAGGVQKGAGRRKGGEMQVGRGRRRGRTGRETLTAPPTLSRLFQSPFLPPPPSHPSLEFTSSPPLSLSPSLPSPLLSTLPPLGERKLGKWRKKRGREMGWEREA